MRPPVQGRMLQDPRSGVESGGGLWGASNNVDPQTSHQRSQSCTAQRHYLCQLQKWIFLNSDLSFQFDFPFAISQEYPRPVQCHLRGGEVGRRASHCGKRQPYCHLWLELLTLGNTPGAWGAEKRPRQARGGEAIAPFASWKLTSIPFLGLLMPSWKTPCGNQDVRQIWPLRPGKEFQLEQRLTLVTHGLHLTRKCVFIWPVPCFKCFSE